MWFEIEFKVVIDVWLFCLVFFSFEVGRGFLCGFFMVVDVDVGVELVGESLELELCKLICFFMCCSVFCCWGVVLGWLIIVEVVDLLDMMEECLVLEFIEDLDMDGGFWFGIWFEMILCVG